MEMMVMVKILMEMPPPNPRRSGDVDGVNFPFTGGSNASGSTLSRSRRELSSPSSPQ
jgi:hypothetical protein